MSGWVGNVVLHDVTHRVMQEQLKGGNFLGHNTSVWLVNTYPKPDKNNRR